MNKQNFIKTIYHLEEKKEVKSIDSLEDDKENDNPVRIYHKIEKEIEG